MGIWGKFQLKTEVVRYIIQMTVLKARVFKKIYFTISIQDGGGNILLVLLSLSFSCTKCKFLLYGASHDPPLQINLPDTGERGSQSDILGFSQC